MASFNASACLPNRSVQLLGHRARPRVPVRAGVTTPSARTCNVGSASAIATTTVSTIKPKLSIIIPTFDSDMLSPTVSITKSARFDVSMDDNNSDDDTSVDDVWFLIELPANRAARLIEAQHELARKAETRRKEEEEARWKFTLCDMFTDNGHFVPPLLGESTPPKEYYVAERQRGLSYFRSFFDARLYEEHLAALEAAGDEEGLRLLHCGFRPIVLPQSTPVDFRVARQLALEACKTDSKLSEMRVICPYSPLFAPLHVRFACVEEVESYFITGYRFVDNTPVLLPPAWTLPAPGTEDHEWQWDYRQEILDTYTDEQLAIVRETCGDLCRHNWAPRHVVYLEPPQPKQQQHQQQQYQQMPAESVAAAGWPV